MEMEGGITQGKSQETQGKPLRIIWSSLEGNKLASHAMRSG